MKAEAARRQRIVVDSNVWISAALNPAGTAALVVRRVLACGMPVFSAATFAELETRLWRPKFDRYLSMELRRRILHDAGAAAIWAEIPAALAECRWCRDADDDAFVRAALAARAPWLVSGDRDLLDIAAPDGLRIVSPAEAAAAADFCT